jgi:sulfoxide reductase heme-binding subunit YedZ
MTMTWLVIRASGLVAYGLLAAATIWGLLLASRLLGRSVQSRALTLTHEGLSLGALAATGIHLGFLAADEYLGFGWRELLVPGAAGWRPEAMALGVVAAWGLLLVGGSCYLRRFIGQKAWRLLHFGALGAYAASTIHGVVAGSDSSNPAVMGLYAGSIVAVVVLLVARVALAGVRPAPCVAGGAAPERSGRQVAVERV